MFDFLGENYYIDINEVENICKINDGSTGKTEISIVKFDAVKMMLEIILTEDQELDNNLKITKEDDLTIPFKIAFNTLLIHKIINYY